MRSTDGLLDVGHDHQSRVAPARGLPSVALAKEGRKAERVGLLHSGSCSWLALLRFFREVVSRPAFEVTLLPVVKLWRLGGHLDLR